MKARGKSYVASLQLDSFMDILTITIGFLWVIVALVSVYASQLVPGAMTPMLQRASKKTPVFFECRNNQLFFVDRVSLQKRFNDFRLSLPEEVQKDRAALINALINADIGDEYYKVRLFTTSDLAVEPRPEAHGETLEEIRSPDSKFQQILQNWDPSKFFIFFIVRFDSIDIFEKARDIALKNEWDVGQEPFSRGQFIEFGGVFGQRVGPQ